MGGLLALDGYLSAFALSYMSMALSAEGCMSHAETRRQMGIASGCTGARSRCTLGGGGGGLHAVEVHSLGVD